MRNVPAVRYGLSASALAAFLALSACGEPLPTPGSEPKPATEPAANTAAPPPPVELPPPPADPADDVIAAQNETRIADLVAIKGALEKYAAAHGGKFPVSNGAQGFQSQWGASLGANWIPELVPTYLPYLPRDPSNHDFSNGSMYLYISDGKDYKLVAHGPPKCASAKLKDGVAVDPTRNSGPDNCWAFGVWSAGGAQK